MIIIYTNGIKTFAALFWFKIISFGLIIYFINDYKRDEFFYYKNLGASKPFLWISALLFDFILFISLLFLALKIK
jgi:hypothetical protein